MENTRYIGYLLAIALVFVVFVAIKMVMPHAEPQKPVDVIGMQLYRPIFFGTDADLQYEKKSEASDELQPPDPHLTENVTKEKVKPVAVASPQTKEAVLYSPSNEDDDERYFEQFLINYKEEVQSKRKYRNDVVVRYYKHEADGERANLLVDYGFYLHIRPVNNPDHYATFESNILYYGKEFPERDIKLIAYLLVRNGIGIKKILPFKDYDGWKRKSIEIGANARLQNAPVLSLSEIRYFKRAE
jgi:hypothetical protein